MNHHLRFVGLATASIALLCSCAKTEPTLPPLKANETRYRIDVFEGPDPYPAKIDKSRAFSPIPSTKVLSIGASMKYKKQLLRDRLYQKRETHWLTLADKGSGKISMTENFTYPSAYDPPKINKAAQTSGSISPVTPATPKDFVKTWIGYELGIKSTSTKVSEHSFNLNLSRRALTGFKNYGSPITAPATGLFGKPVKIVITENRIEVPDFIAHKLKQDFTFATGQTLVITGRDPNEKRRKNDKAIHDYREQKGAGSSGNFVIFISPFQQITNSITGSE